MDAHSPLFRRLGLDLYAPDAMPADLRAAHERNDEVLERIYIGRRFKNDTERLEKLFDLFDEEIHVSDAFFINPSSRDVFSPCHSVFR